jgi:hypothetical protein
MPNPLDDLIQRRLAGSAATLPNDEETRELLPTVWSFLTRQDVNGEFAKDPASITIRLGLGSWMVELHDPTLEVGFSVGVERLATALQELEAALNNPRAIFRPWKGSTGKFKKVNKKAPGHPQEGG